MEQKDDARVRPASSQAPGEEGRARLLELIGDRQTEVGTYLDRKRPMVKWLRRITVIGSAVSAVAAGGPGVGGTDLTDAIQDLLGLPDSVQVWRVLCLLAMILAGVVAFSARALQSDDLAKGIVGAEAVSRELDDLATLVEFRHVEVDVAVNLFRDISARVPSPA